jgi:hypothetical protein
MNLIKKSLHWVTSGQEMLKEILCVYYRESGQNRNQVRIHVFLILPCMIFTYAYVLLVYMHFHLEEELKENMQIAI